jgi:TonB family protein
MNQPGKDPSPSSDHHVDADYSYIMDAAFAHHNNHHRHIKIGYLISLYAVLLMIWLPGFSLKDKVYTFNPEEHKPVIRKVLRPPPEAPMERVVTKTKKARRVPMPDLSPDEPEPIVEPDPPDPPEVFATDDWEIGIPDAPPPVTEATEQIARVGQIGVEPPIFSKKVMPDYPKKALSVKIKGYVILEAVLRKDGSVDNIKVLRGIGKGKFGFEEEAVKALKKWEFLPGKVNGRNADVQMTLKVDFQIKKGGVI